VTTQPELLLVVVPPVVVVVDVVVELAAERYQSLGGIDCARLRSLRFSWSSLADAFRVR